MWSLNETIDYHILSGLAPRKSRPLSASRRQPNEDSLQLGESSEEEVVNAIEAENRNIELSKIGEL